MTEVFLYAVVYLLVSENVAHESVSWCLISHPSSLDVVVESQKGERYNLYLKVKSEYTFGYLKSVVSLYCTRHGSGSGIAYYCKLLHVRINGRWWMCEEFACLTFLSCFPSFSSVIDSFAFLPSLSAGW